MSKVVANSIESKSGGPVNFPNGLTVGNGGSFNNINYIGLAGQQGFGVGICPSLPTGFAVMAGTSDIASDNYGNYIYSDGSVMCWVPAFYYKIGTGSNGLAINIVSIKGINDYADVSAANAAGYALHRAFYNAGAIQPGFFKDKYEASNNVGVASSIKNGLPLSSAAAHNPFSGLTGTPSNTYAGAIAAVKTRGSKFFPCTRFIDDAIAMLSYAHAKATTSATSCAWYDATGVKNFPKGNNNNALGDANDTMLSFVSDGYSNCAKTGSANFFARTTHNGQNCGIADVNGNIWEINLGMMAHVPTSTGTGYTSGTAGYSTGTTSIPIITGTGTVVAGDMITFAGDSQQYAVTTGVSAPGTIVISPGLKVALPASAVAMSIVPASFYLLKTGVDAATITAGNTLATDGWGAVGIATMYDNIGATYGALTASSTAKYFGSAGQVFSEAVSGVAWAAACAGIPLVGGVGGTNQFGNDALYDYMVNGLCPLAGGSWTGGSPAGVWALNLGSVRGDSSHDVGCRAALYL